MTSLKQSIRKRLPCAMERVLISLIASLLLSASGSFGSVAGSDAVTLGADDSYEPNDSWSKAYTGLADGVWLSDHNGLGVSLDEDWFRINVSDPSSLRIQIECLFTHDEGDIDIVLFDSTGNNVIGTDAMSNTDNEYLDVTVPATGYYYLKIWCRYGYSGNSYNLRWKALLTGEDNYEPNNSLEDAYDGLPEGVRLSTINGSGFQCDDDWYRINVTDDACRRVVVDCTFLQSEGDIDIALYDATGKQLNCPWTRTDNEQIDFVVPSTGYYYVKVCFGNAGNVYDLCWNTLSYTPPALTSISISGAAWVDELKSAPYTCTATYSDGNTSNVTSETTWDDNSSYASISGGGVLSASSVSVDTPVTITAAYGGKSDDKVVTIKNVPPLLISISISGLDEVDENSSEAYGCTALYSDGHSENVSTTAIWSENSYDASINTSGVLVTGDVVSNELLTISASYSEKGVDKAVTIRNVRMSYLEWISSQDVPEDRILPEDIVADDGIPNLLKYACGLPAHDVCSAADLMTVVRGNGSTGMFSIDYKRSKIAVDALLEVLWAPTPATPVGSWVPVEMTEVIGEEGDLELRRASIPLIGRGFMRLRATSL